MPVGRTTALSVALPKLLRRGRTAGARKLIDGARAEDLAVAFRRLKVAQRLTAFELIKEREVRAALVAELDPPIAHDLLAALPDDEILALVSIMDADDAADIVELLPEPRRELVLGRLRKAGEQDVTELVHYDPETAAGIMTPEVFALTESTTVSEAIRTLQAHGDEFELTYYLYVTDQDGRLVGVCSLRQLVLSQPDTALRDIMERDTVTVEMSTDQEEVARIVARYNLLAVPVVDPSGRLVGTVTVDDIIDVIRLEATEDMLRMAGAAGDELDAQQQNTLRAARARLPWLFASFLGGNLAALLIGFFEPALEQVVPLAAFIPIVLGMGGNVGIQSATIVTRGLALGRIDTTQLLRVTARETGVAVVCGIAYGVLLAIVAWLRYSGSEQVESGIMLGGTVGMAVGVGMVMAAAFGAGVPILFARINVDPALAAGPFVTSAVDVLGIAVYFVIAMLLLGL